ncbi:unnamed protein product [Pelagomonas calceolata]|uniref:Uncharacterized protein n=1 Tax=Pelagomonas calceolata TaxID=35677 RepID=A0A8J2SBW2_9STRA|nr:unnamed protein product [Pelagomonas calceolata]
MRERQRPAHGTYGALRHLLEQRVVFVVRREGPFPRAVLRRERVVDGGLERREIQGRRQRVVADLQDHAVPRRVRRVLRVDRRGQRHERSGYRELFGHGARDRRDSGGLQWVALRHENGLPLGYPRPQRRGDASCHLGRVALVPSAGASLDYYRCEVFELRECGRACQQAAADLHGTSSSQCRRVVTARRQSAEAVLVQARLLSFAAS